MNVLVACEESQRVCTAFREKGHNAFSCDILPCSGGHPEWHIQGDVLAVLNKKHIPFAGEGVEFQTADGKYHFCVGGWDLIIAFPPCTHLAVSGARHFEKKRADGRQRDAIEFFCQFLNADCDRIAIENPVGIISGDYTQKHFPDLAEKYGLPKKPTQIIQPYEYGDPHRKTTCLWTRGLPILKSTSIVEPNILEYTCKNGKKVSFDIIMAKCKDPGVRSKTFPGVAKAMAEQWG